MFSESKSGGLGFWDDFNWGAFVKKGDVVSVAVTGSNLSDVKYGIEAIIAPYV